MKLVVYTGPKHQTQKDLQLYDPYGVFHFGNHNLVREWNIWSKCFGKVVVINGTTSAGKSTLCKYLSRFGFNTISLDNVFDEYFYDSLTTPSQYVSTEFIEKFYSVKRILTNRDMFKILDGFPIKENAYKEYELEIVRDLQKDIPKVVKHITMPTKVEVSDRIYHKAKEFIFSGRDIILDLAFSNSDFDILSYSFGYYPITIGLLYASLEESLRKCLQRSYVFFKDGNEDCRYPSQVIWQYKDFYRFVSSDNFGTSYKFLEKFDKVKVKTFLETAICCELNLLSNIKDIGADAYNPKMLKRSIEALNHAMSFDTFKEVVVVPNVKHDFIIKSSDLKIVIKSIGNESKLSCIETDALSKIEDIFTKQNVVTDQLIKITNTEFMTKDINKIADLFDIRFIVYSGESTLPTIIGNNNRFVVECEYIEEDKKYENFALIGDVSKLTDYFEDIF